MIQVFQIEATSGGWAVRSEGVENSQMYVSGAKAEACARGLAERLSREGLASEIRIRLRDGSDTARFISAPAPHCLALAD